MQNDQRKRQKEFVKWWGMNKTHRPSHKWLIKHTARVLHSYDLHPNNWDHAKKITKRYNLSEYKRLNRSDAWYLWRITHPLHSERVERILATGAFLMEAMQKRKEQNK